MVPPSGSALLASSAEAKIPVITMLSVLSAEVKVELTNKVHICILRNRNSVYFKSSNNKLSIKETPS
jgi:hypothetical protein